MRPGRDVVLLQHAALAALRGTCSRAQVGAVVALEGRILSTGYNGAPSGMAHCDHTGQLTSLVVDGVEQIKDPGCQVAVHAEANAIAFAARHGVALLNSTIYCTSSPCVKCAQLIINAGIERVVFLSEYRDPAGRKLLKNAGIALVHLPMI